jgi:hypothetical protein
MGVRFCACIRYTVTGAGFPLSYLERQVMTARFAYRRARASAKATAAAKPTRTPATPATSLPKGGLPARRDAFKEVCVFRAGGAGRTTISIPISEYEHMLSFAGESHAAVEKACVEASLVLELMEGEAWTETVGAGAMLELMLAFQARRKAKPGRKAK